VVYRGAYEYGQQDGDSDYVSQDQAPADVAARRPVLVPETP